MELTGVIAVLAAILPIAYGAPVEAAANLHPDVLAAMKRDLGLDAREATARVAFDREAGEVIKKLSASLKGSFAGGWVENGKTIKVGVTDEAAAAKVKDAGATPTVVDNSLDKLQDAKKALDKLFKQQTKALDASSDTGVAAFFIDVTANKLVIEALADSTAHAEKLAKQVGLSSSEFEVRKVAKMPVPFLVGGDAYIIDNIARCSVGFTVQGGFVSAGHCGQVGSSVTYTDGTPLGTFAGSVFPGDADMSWITTVDGTDLQPFVGGWGGGDQPITGSAQAPVGSGICRSGSTTGVQCGTVQAFEATVMYPEGTITGLTQTDACAEPGDSGGSFYSGDQAQGVTSGGSGDCSSGGTTFFQPVNEILETYGLTLLTA